MNIRNNTAPQRIVSQFDAGSTAHDVIQGVDLGGKTAIVTGGGSGIGFEIARSLAAAGANVTIADLDDAGAARAVRTIEAESTGARVKAGHLDLGLLTSVRTFASEFIAANPSVDILINNAGLMAPPFGRTKDGHELQFGINYLGHFVLTRELLSALRAEGGARVISVSSIGHRRSDIHFDDPDYRQRPYDRWDAYGQSKTACSLLAVALSERYGGEGIFANAVNPGGSMTGLQRHLSQDELRELGWIDTRGAVNVRWRSPAQCAATSVWLATAPELAGVGGRYFEECAEAEPWRPDAPLKGVRDYALSPENASSLWDLSTTLV